MTIGQKTRMRATPDDRAWAAKVLNVPEDASPNRTAGLVLQRLEQEQFMPAAEMRDAIEILAQHRTTGTAVRNHQRLELLEQLQSFRSEFWSLSLPERTALYHELLFQTAYYPEIRHYLETLEPGLRVDASGLDSETDEDVKELGRTLCRQFLMGQADRAKSRRCWQAEHAPRTWKHIVRRLQTRYPAVAGLDTEWCKRLRREQVHFVPRQSRVKQVIRKTSKALDPSREISTGRGVALIFLVIVLGVITAAFRNGSTPSPRSDPFFYKAPQFKMPEFTPPNIRIDPEVWRKLHETNEDHRRRVEAWNRLMGTPRERWPEAVAEDIGTFSPEGRPITDLERLILRQALERALRMHQSEPEPAIAEKP